MTTGPQPSTVTDRGAAPATTVRVVALPGTPSVTGTRQRTAVVERGSIAKWPWERTTVVRSPLQRCDRSATSGTPDCNVRSWAIAAIGRVPCSSIARQKSSVTVLP